VDAAWCLLLAIVLLFGVHADSFPAFSLVECVIGDIMSPALECVFDGSTSFRAHFRPRPHRTGNEPDGATPAARATCSQSPECCKFAERLLTHNEFFSAAGSVIHLCPSSMAVFAVLRVPSSLIGDNDNLIAASGPRC
jgi:hypothetical protein